MFQTTNQIRMNLILGYSGLRIAETLVLYESPKLEAGAWLLAFVKCCERFHAGVGLLPCPEENVENQGRNATIEMPNQEGNQRAKYRRSIFRHLLSVLALLETSLAHCLYTSHWALWVPSDFAGSQATAARAARSQLCRSTLSSHSTQNKVLITFIYIYTIYNITYFYNFDSIVLSDVLLCNHPGITHSLTHSLSLSLFLSLPLSFFFLSLPLWIYYTDLNYIHPVNICFPTSPVCLRHCPPWRWAPNGSRSPNRCRLPRPRTGMNFMLMLGWESIDVKIWDTIGELPMVKLQQT